MLKIDTASRWGVEYQRPGSRAWVLLGTLGSHRAAEQWLTRFHGSGSFRVRRPLRSLPPKG